MWPDEGGRSPERFEVALAVFGAIGGPLFQAQRLIVVEDKTPGPLAAFRIQNFGPGDLGKHATLLNRFFISAFKSVGAET